MIPAEAVEAGKRAYLSEFPHDENAAYIARIILEAAAPYMLETGKGKGPIVVPVPRSAVTNLYRTRT